MKKCGSPQSMKDGRMYQSQQMNQKSKHNENLVKITKCTSGERKTKYQSDTQEVAHTTMNAPNSLTNTNFWS